ncbi:4-amino-4-deoxychorismate lyase [Pedobacter sp. HMF7647]|uniref:branched-chain-amino-acid transaminase n=1 Tax=Hufsiella arboris TaxID=2695275 RepID=A0A7K1Y9Q8_9SPHI|nr:aminotransferase class IV [Hufsiella arboris]MXV51326.1 4-amino-4-deoxychorismate lyase [Hufsiella arboris]
MRDFINFNGEIFPSDQPLLTIHNRGFRYGDGLFESMRVIKGSLKFAEHHAERLETGMKGLKLEGYNKFDSYFFKEKCDELLRRNKLSNARLRLTVFREGAGLYSPDENQSAYCLEATKTEDSSYKRNPRGLIIDVFDDVTKPINSLSNFKTCNSLPFVMAGIYKNQNKLDEVLILNQQGLLCEAMSSNVFVVYDRKIYTPALSQGCIAGVMRSVVMTLAQENGFELIEAEINPQILNEAEEVFLTNASRGIQWVMGYGRKRYFYETSKILIDKLNELVR